MEKTKGELQQPSNEYKPPVIELQGIICLLAFVSFVS